MKQKKQIVAHVDAKQHLQYHTVIYEPVIDNYLFYHDNYADNSARPLAQNIFEILVVSSHHKDERFVEYLRYVFFCYIRKRYSIF